MEFNYPRILHMFWYGKLPFLNFLTIVSFRRYHPNWKIKVYTVSKCETKMEWSTKEHRNRFETDFDYFPLLKNYSIEIIPIDNWIIENNLSQHHFIHQSDILRIHQLWKEGGVWSDFDIIYIKNIENVIRGKRDVLIFTPYYFPVGLLISQPNSEIYHQIFEYQMTLQPDITNYQMYGVVCLSQFLSVHKELLSNVDILPREVYLPADWKQLNLLFEKRIESFPSITVGIHWFNGSMNAQEYMKKLKKDQNIICTIDLLISEYLSVMQKPNT